MKKLTDKEWLDKDQMLACKDGEICVVDNEQIHRHLEREGGWSFRVYTPKRPRKPSVTSPNWIEETQIGLRIPLGE